MKAILVLLALLIGPFAYAQYTAGGGGAFVIGTQLLPTDELQAFSPGAPAVATANTSIGGYGYGQFQSFIIGFKGSGYYGSEKTDDNNSYKRGGGSFQVDFGYKVVNKDRLGLYPLIGLGYGGMGYRISRLGDIDLANGEGAVPYEAEYTIGNFIFDVGVRIERLFGLQSDDCGKGGGMFGIELGYQFSPESSNWKTGTGGSVLNAPGYSLQGLYVRLLIGGFGATGSNSSIAK